MKRYYLSITTWTGICPGAIHFYGRIHGEYKKITPKTKYSLDFDREDHDVDNGKDGVAWTTQFKNRKEVIKRAIETFQRLKLKGMLYIGDAGTVMPQRVLIAPPSVYEKAREENRLWQRTERLYRIGGDDPWKAGYGKEMDELCERWKKLWEE